MSPTSQTEFASRTLADIASTLPGATALFREEKLDFCCGGKISLAEAMAAKQKDPAPLTTRLAALEAAAAPSDGPEDTDDLIDMILTRFHETHRREVPELVKLARRVEAVHRDVASVPAGLADLLQHIGDELESHMQKEEHILFPMIRSGGHPMIEGPISVMLAEHEEHGANLRKLEALTNDFMPPARTTSCSRASLPDQRHLPPLRKIKASHRLMGQFA
jgi:regulator of cell morphogenesis and NO signaling